MPAESASAVASGNPLCSRSCSSFSNDLSQRGASGQLRDIAAELGALMLEAGAALVDFRLLLTRLFP